MKGFPRRRSGCAAFRAKPNRSWCCATSALAELTGGAVHIAHMSARQSLDAVRYGKSRGARVTCEVTPHHFVLTDEMLASPRPYDTNVKMNPPLRDELDRDAMLHGTRRRHRRRDRHRSRAASLR